MLLAGWPGQVFSQTNHSMIDYTLRNHTAAIVSMIYYNSSTLFTGSWDDTVIQWDLHKRAMVRQFRHGDDVHNIMVYNGLLYSTGKDGVIREWRINDGELLRIFTVTAPQPVWGLGVIMSQNLLVSSGWDSKVRFWSLDTGLSVDEIDVCSSWDLIVKDATTVYLGCNSGRIQEVDLITRNITTFIQFHIGKVRKLYIDGFFLYAAGSQSVKTPGMVSQWDMGTRTLIASYNITGISGQSGEAVLTAGECLFTAAAGGSVRKFNQTTKEQLDVVTDPKNIWSLGIYNRTLAAGTSDGRIIVFKEAFVPAYPFIVSARGLVQSESTSRTASLVPTRTSASSTSISTSTGYYNNLSDRESSFHLTPLVIAVFGLLLLIPPAITLAIIYAIGYRTPKVTVQTNTK